MKQYCRHCAFCINGDCYYCTCKNKVLHNIKRVTNCTDYALSELGDVDTGKQYKPRKSISKTELSQISLFKEECKE